MKHQKQMIAMANRLSLELEQQRLENTRMTKLLEQLPELSRRITMLKLAQNANQKLIALLLRETGPMEFTYKQLQEEQPQLTASETENGMRFECPSSPVSETQTSQDGSQPLTTPGRTD
jgi:hypothetical protein